MAPPGKNDIKYHNKATSCAALDAKTSAYPEIPPYWKVKNNVMIIDPI